MKSNVPSRSKPVLALSLSQWVDWQWTSGGFQSGEVEEQPFGFEPLGPSQKRNREAGAQGWR